MLSEESLELLETNPMLLLDSDDEDEKILASQAPSMVPKFLKKDSKAHYEKFKEYLDLLGISYTQDNTLVSKNDYSTNSIWEFRSNE
jgi:histidyl-tRNA synthetase